MNCHRTSTDESYYAFSPWPDSSTYGEEMAVWAQAAGYAQQGLTSDTFSFDGLDATDVWGQSAMLPAETFGFRNTSLDTDWTSGSMFPVGDTLGNGALLADATAADAIALALAPPLAFPTDIMDGSMQDFFYSQSYFSELLSSSPSPTDFSTVPCPQSNGTGGGFIPFPTYEGASSYFVQPQGPSFSQLNITGALLPNRFAYVPPSGDVNLTGQVSQDYSPVLDLMGMSSDMPYLEQLDNTKPSGSLAAPTEVLSVMVTSETSSLGKRSHRRFETHNYGLPQADDEDSEENESRPQKRAKPNATRVRGGAESIKRTHRSPSTRAQQNINRKSKAAGRGAGRLAPTMARGVYHRPLSGLSVSQGSVGALEQGQLSWIEEREVETWHNAGCSALQLEIAEDREELHAIPKKLSARYRLMLQTTQADEERGAVRHINCKLCPTVQFGSWETYKRHCKSCEKHPSELRFCSRCGDYFGRPDSKIRHHKDKKYQEACRSTFPDEAREKKQKVERLLGEFEARLEHCLRNGEEIGPGFSDIVNKKLANTSKKVSKQEEIWLEGSSWATGLS